MIDYDCLDYYPNHVKTYYVHYVEGLEALAASRLELLRRENTIRFSRGKQCFFCDKYPLLNHKIGSEYEKVYLDNHTDDCEWAKELGDGGKRIYRNVREC